MNDLTKEELLLADASDFDSDALRFSGPRGDRSRHLDRERLMAGIAALPAPPRDRGTVDLLVARPTEGGRLLHDAVELTVDGGMPCDRWAEQSKFGPDYQLATTRTDFARLVASGQPLELHGDNLFVSLDLSKANLPIGSRVQLGDAEAEVTPVAHNGCKKWVQRFGLAAMKLNMEPLGQRLHLRGIYLRVVSAGRVRRGDEVRVTFRPC